MAQDNTQSEPDGYYGEEGVQDEELDLSFLDEDKDGDKKEDAK